MPAMVHQGGRILIHCDLDAFFAAVETIHDDLDPSVPLIIGSDPSSGQGRGVVSTCNYAAREFGIRSAMPISEAWRRCPAPPLGPALYRRGRFNLYRRASRRVMRILAAEADQFEPAGVDEAYLDVTEACESDWDLAEALARRMQKAIFDDIGLTASFGVGPTRVAAKMSSEYNKPNGIYVARPESLTEFFSPQDTRAVPGIGPKSAQDLAESGIYILEDAIVEGESGLSRILGERRGRSLARILDGYSSDEVSPIRSRKSIGKERTFNRDVINPDVVLERLRELVTRVVAKLMELGIAARVLEVKLRYRGFETLNHARSLPVAMDDEEVFRRLADGLLTDVYDTSRPVRLIGFRVGDLDAPPNRQATLEAFAYADEGSDSSHWATEWDTPD